MTELVEDIQDGIERATQFCDVRDLNSDWHRLAAKGVPERAAILEGFAAGVMERLMLLTSVDGTMIYDRVGRSVVELLGHDPTGRLLRDLDNPGVRPFVPRYMEAALAGRPRFVVQHQIGLNSIGTNERLLLPALRGDVVQLVVYIRSRGEARDIMRSVFNASSDSITVLQAVRDESGAITDFLIQAANAESARRMNLQPDGMVGHLLLEFFPIARVNGALARMIKAVETQTPDVFDTRYPYRDAIVERQLRLVPNGEQLTVTNIDLGPQRMASSAIEKQRNELLTANTLLAYQAADLKASNEALAETARELRAEIERNHELESELIRRARFDSLTELPNRSFFEMRFHDVLEDARLNGRKVALCILDVDHFKDINDQFGHNTGDVVLREVSRRLVQAIRPGDVAGRLGGDEFAVLLGDTADLDAARAAVKHMVEAVMAPLTVLRQDVPVSLSAGIAIFPTDGAGETELMAAADLAVYRAKRTGRGRPVFYESSMRAAADRRSRLMLSLAKAIADGELRPFYQPLMDLRTSQLVGFEALVRWYHPTRGILSPAFFSEAFDEPELARAITGAMFAAVATDLASWSASPIPRHVSVNVTAFDLRQDGFAVDLKRLLEQHGLSSSQIAIEVTETTVLSRDGERIAETLAELRSLGFSVALDDFGTGYASLSHLLTFPCDSIKIDRSFVANVDRSAKTTAIIRSMVALAAALGLDIVAEGVETRAELDAIRALDCHLVQGFLISAPLPRESIPAFVANFAPRLPPLFRPSRASV